MPVNKDFNVSPYFDDFDETKNYHKIAFKPSQAVQVRELNQLQTMLQNQIEKFGNNIYKRGTIIDGVNFVYHPNYNYVKINDSQLDNVPAAPSEYVNSFISDPTTNLTAMIINSADGYESTSPDLKTLYLRYINSGDSGEETEFNPGSTLKIYDYLDSINKITIVNGSTGFANNDSVVLCAAIAVNVTSSNVFSVGETITQSGGNTHVAIINSIETLNGNTILHLRPRQSDLTNTEVSSTIWQFDSNTNIVGSATSASATVIETIGTGASATLTTSASTGKINKISIVDHGQGYYVSPYATIKSSGAVNETGSRNYNDLSLTAQNYIAQVVVNEEESSVGEGYAFGVTEGVIYQKGYFLHVDPQVVIVDKYSSSPDSVSVGFDTTEFMVDSNTDETLLDNATGTKNEFAPGADRLQLVPELVVISANQAASNNEFFSVVDFSEGTAFKENKQTQYSTLMDNMAVRTKEQSGNFVLDQFLVTTRSTSNQANEGSRISVVTDPGIGYIDGYRIQTSSNYTVNIDKGVDTRSASAINTTIDYGNYIIVQEFAGNLNFDIGATVKLYDTARGYVSNTSLVTTGTIAPTGTQIGTAQVRSVVYDNGVVGTPSATYRIYLFNIKMNNAMNFSQVRSIYYDSTNDGIADVVLTFDATSNSSIAKLKDITAGTSLLLDTGSDATNNLDNINYIYRMVDESVQIQPTGSATALLSDPSEYFAYESATLTSNELDSLVVIPTSNNVLLQVNAAANGTASVTTSSNAVTMSIAATINSYDIGDFAAVYSDATNYVLRRVTGKTASQLVFDSNLGFTLSNANITKAFPKNVPINIDKIGGSGTLTSGGKSLNLDIGALQNDVAVNLSVAYDVKVLDASPITKVANRDLFVKLDLSNNSALLNGPWCLGVPDVFRLKSVYLANSSVVNVSSTDVTDQFYIDNNQTPGYVGLSYLIKRPDANINLPAGTFLLVQFDAFTSGSGVYTINSYVSSNTAQRFADDSLTLDALGTKVNSFEIPEMNTSSGRYFDMANTIDFRPIVANTANLSTSVAAATVNPAEGVTFGGNNKKFPLPQSGVTFDRSYFLGRKDIVVINTDNKISVIRGTPSETVPYPEPKVPAKSIVLSKLEIPSYPCLPEHFSPNTLKIIDKKMSSETELVRRIIDKTIFSELTQSEIDAAQPRAYTMSDIGQLDRRLSNLEATVALTLVENDLKDKVIPSTVDPTINRFKFGFFADDFNNGNNSDTMNPEYQASIVNSRVLPFAESTLVTHGKGFMIGSFTGQYALINQDQASVPAPPPAPPSPTPPPSSPSPTPSPVPAPSPSPAPPIVTPPSPTPPAPTPSPPSPPVDTTNYTAAAYVLPGSFSAQGIGLASQFTNYNITNITQTCGLVGLKPNTLHTVSIAANEDPDEYQISVNITGAQAAGGNKIMSDSTGKANFVVTLDAYGISTINRLVQNYIWSNTTLFEYINVHVASSDNRSTCDFTIHLNARLSPQKEYYN